MRTIIAPDSFSRLLAAFEGCFDGDLANTSWVMRTCDTAGEVSCGHGAGPSAMSMVHAECRVRARGGRVSHSPSRTTLRAIAVRT